MNGDRAHGLTADHLAQQLATLGDDNSAERLDLKRALTGWHEATHQHTGDSAGQLQWDNPRGATSINISTQQADRLTRLLNVDTAVVTAHRAATRTD